jgi:hypothetical protein
MGLTSFCQPEWANFTLVRAFVLCDTGMGAGPITAHSFADNLTHFRKNVKMLGEEVLFWSSTLSYPWLENLQVFCNSYAL